ncbi:MAG: hypothetical protein R3Y05_01250 [bacterium]
MELTLYAREVKIKSPVNQYGKQGMVQHVEYFYCTSEDFLKKAQYRKHFKFQEMKETEFSEKYENISLMIGNNEIYRERIE